LNEPDKRTTRKFGIAGCDPATGNLGVSALAHATIAGLERTGAPLSLALFDRGSGIRRAGLGRAGGEALERIPAFLSRRFYSASNLQHLHLAARLGLATVHPRLRHLRGLDAILDISGGDSFSDLYGARRFQGQTLLKQIALELAVPLVLLPQTYGPFRDPANRDEAARIVRHCAQAWARDARSFAALRELAGPHFDPERHREGVDVAFGLEPREPADTSLVARVLRFQEGQGPLLGLNVSGLLYALSEAACRAQFEFRGSYRELMGSLLRGLLAVPDARIMLVSHVLPAAYAEGGDLEAGQALVDDLAPSEAERVFVLPPILHPGEVKWAIGRCDWFCGTRMHACIAALSQGIPTLGIAYSDKAQGVFETAGAGEWVADPRKSSSPSIVEFALASLDRCEEQRAVQARALKEVRARLDLQFAAIVSRREDPV